MEILEAIPNGTDGWNAIMTTNFQKIEGGLINTLNDIAGKTADIQIKGSGNDGTSTSLEIKNSDGSILFKIKNDGTIQMGNDTNNLTIDNDGEWTLNGTATRFEDIRISSLETKLLGSKDPGIAKFKDNGSGSQGVVMYWFDASTEEELYFNVQIPHEWKLESTIYPHVHWVPYTSSDGTPANQVVKWGLEYTISQIGGTFGNTSFCYGTVHYPEDADVVAGKHYLTELDAISMTGIDTVSAMLVCRVFRAATDGADTYEHDAGLLEIDFHFEIDTPGGSKEETSK